MSAFNAALAILMQAHGNVTVAEDAPGIPQQLDSLLLNSIDPDPQREEMVKTGGMGEEALTLWKKPTYELSVDAEQTANTGPWQNRHPGEVLTYSTMTLYAAMADIRHGYPSGNGCSWSIKSPKQQVRAGDLRTNRLVVKLLFKPTLSAQLVSAA